MRLPFSISISVSVTAANCLNSRGSYHRGVLSTIFLVLVDVDKSRVECEEFIRAEAERKAFETSGHITSAFTGDMDVRIGDSDT